ncbi:hypothetical protein H5410_048444 [Solanum commersonii]|uniref:Uncharacterized protein n=1 Tax=Solanum commersonii TaxID=4109 RepID=A0A9J5XJV0_SOLCO|nr:hypothetical protein H5410_048444 [Solanum commersonii]
MEKATFRKVFVISVLLMLFEQGSHAKRGCTKDADCDKIIKCIDADPKCDLKKHKCYCPVPPNYGTKRGQRCIDAHPICDLKTHKCIYLFSSTN